MIKIAVDPASLVPAERKSNSPCLISIWRALPTSVLAAHLRGERLLPAAEAVEIFRALPHGRMLAAVTHRAAQRSCSTAAVATLKTRSCDWHDNRANARSQHRQSFAGLGSEQSFIETTLARWHLKKGALLLYDVLKDVAATRP